MGTAAFVNNFFMAGYVAVGIDMGFERVTDHRYRTRDTAEIAPRLARVAARPRGDRFFLFANYNSPHEPYDPPERHAGAGPPAPAGPGDRQVRAYMAEAAKDDAAIGELLGELDALELTRSTLVVVTADHGETLSTAHDGDGLEGIHQRFHHAVGNYEETTRIPLVMALPGVLDGGKAVTERVRSTDIAPTVLEVLGLEPDPRMSGRSLVRLARGEREPDPRVVVSEGRQSRAILWDHFRLIAHDGSDQPALFDLDVDPGERHDVARAHADVVAELQARLAAAVANVPAADARARGGTAGAPDHPPALCHRRAGPAVSSGSSTVGDDRHGAAFTFSAVGVPGEALHADGPRLTFAFTTAADAVVGLDLRTDPPGPPSRGGSSSTTRRGPPARRSPVPSGCPPWLRRPGSRETRRGPRPTSAALPTVDPARDLGLFVTRDRPGEAAAPDDTGPAGGGAAAAREMQQVLQQWGYAHGSH